ncbi:P-loop NTPase fold protein [Ralstonia pseudosolanacearum]|uniref:P-loop NTPase fold protein n=1 Tax=Ralstonia pseudosolanacearum TaxID=1310165 RepID=UPI0026758037|nr:P-loop NTPase fold protein [Ralstonia pseudosolanacearum]MDO3523975.1 P-loop NTPase fold protein [Ralstonia pseudosolanacearum]MDO3548364.1 P-loop NTPase fold protein [Ralstonia pseudosolanacearum]MDO3553418.1 P-loop NTPase fold protein [Ralstonia pseudosolanacearum]MDO3567278.1 P-loop NTPase fold protein [Ralstonia pseudosolanacearum]MDO3582830.1 P-loop NTPase fold protein [Ralstonia pseudosolanacearum]
MTDKRAAELSSDRPSTDPAQDLFGHAPFAKTLAKAIRGYRGSDGIVLALYGPWGSGKSTVLAYIEHELEQGPEATRDVSAGSSAVRPRMRTHEGRQGPRFL